MTIGVGYKTDKYFVCFTDIQVVDDESSLHSNSCRKMLLLNFGKHHGVIYASGDGDTTDAAFVTASMLAQKHLIDDKITLDFFVESLIEPLCKYNEKREEQIITLEKLRLTTEKKVFDSVSEKEKYVAKQTEKIIEKIKEDRKQTDSYMKLAFYDGVQEMPRVFSIELLLENNDAFIRESFEPTTSIGIGADNAEVYFSLFGRQLYADSLCVPDILCITAGAYNYATLMRDVEGTPHVCVIDKNRARILPHEESAILANASAAHIAELLDFRKEKMYADELYAMLRKPQKERKSIISKIANDFVSTTGVNIDITLAAIKLSTWGEIAARKLFRNKS
ncbi:hypothetical protein HY485_01615 [Candidatus Woesearchaeota archaeon]|nr:hypothetical protein [Candidatus Woesearchaeota archaeon]